MEMGKRKREGDVDKISDGSSTVDTAKKLKQREDTLEKLVSLLSSTSEGSLVAG